MDVSVSLFDRCELPYQSQPNFVPTSSPTQGRFLTQVWPHQSNPVTPGYPNLQNLNRSQEKNFALQKMHQIFPGQRQEIYNII